MEYLCAYTFRRVIIILASYSGFVINQIDSKPACLAFVPFKILTVCIMHVAILAILVFYRANESSTN